MCVSLGHDNDGYFGINRPLLSSGVFSESTGAIQLSRTMIFYDRPTLKKLLVHVANMYKVIAIMIQINGDNQPGKWRRNVISIEEYCKHGEKHDTGHTFPHVHVTRQPEAASWSRILVRVDVVAAFQQRYTRHLHLKPIVFTLNSMPSN